MITLQVSSGKKGRLEMAEVINRERIMMVVVNNHLVIRNKTINNNNNALNSLFRIITQIHTKEATSNSKM